MTSPSTDPAALSLAASLLLAGILTYRCWSPPNPNPSGPSASLPKDHLGAGAGPGPIQTRRLIALSLWLLHVLNALFYPRPPALLCPRPSNLARALFTWSPYTAAVLLAVAAAAPLRLLAFRHLGRSFTFRLARPNKLVTTGLYARVQHPSYPTNWVVLVANVALLLRLDGVVGCVLPGSVVRWGMGSGAWPAVLVGLGMLGLFGIWVRVRDEEEMLRKEFGREWEEYHRRTSRFIPGVF